MQNEFNDKIIISETLAAFLILQGCELKKSKVDLKNQTRRVFFFEEDPFIGKCMMEYTKYVDILHSLDRIVEREPSKGEQYE